MIPFQFPDLVSKKPKIRGFGWSFNGMREQGSLKGEGTHRGNLCVPIFKPNLPSKDLLSKVLLQGQFTFRSPDREGYRNA